MHDREAALASVILASLTKDIDYAHVTLVPVHPKGDQSWMFIRRTDVEAETPVLWPLDAKSWLIWKDPDAGKDWRWEEKGMTEDEMAGWHHRLHEHESEWTLEVGDGQGGLVCCSPWGCKELDTTEQLNWTLARENNPKRVWFGYLLTFWPVYRQDVSFLFRIY